MSVCVCLQSTCEPQQALALVVVLLVDAGGVVLAGPRRTLVDVDLAGGSLETRNAEAVELCHPVDANGSILAGLRPTLVHIFCAGLALESWCAAALEAFWLQVAGSVVLAGQVQTVAHVGPALPSSESLRTPAEVPIELVHAQRAGCEAGVAGTLIHFLGAVVPREPVQAAAGVLCGSRGAGAVLTQGEGAGVVELVAVLAHVPDALRGTDAGVVVHSVHAGGPVLAGRRQTPVRRGRAQGSWKQTSKTNQRIREEHRGFPLLKDSTFLMFNDTHV